MKGRSKERPHHLNPKNGSYIVTGAGLRLALNDALRQYEAFGDFGLDEAAVRLAAALRRRNLR